MYKNATYKEKYADLSPLMSLIIEATKKDLKNDHLKKDFVFNKKFLGSKNIQKVTVEELVNAYQQAIAEAENGEEIAEFITSRWLLKNSDVYEFFENYLSQLTADFTTLEEIDSENSTKLIEASIQEFGAPRTYLFSVLNSVVFPCAIFERLKKQAHETQVEELEQKEQLNEKLTLDHIQRKYETEMARLVDKYEKKLAGLQKKYTTDVDNLKKQIANLQRKLQEKTS